jgi:peptide/nickel transport system substrate-binding protein
MKNPEGHALTPALSQRERGPFRLAAVALILTYLLACSSPSGTPGRSVDAGARASDAAPARTLVAAVRVEPATLAMRTLHPSGVALYLSKGMFNAGIAYLDDKAQPLPHLAEALPKLNTDSWKIAPDGHMETTYRLKAGTKWHDGQPLTADDFVFAWRVYTTPGISEPGATPWPSIDNV